MAKKHSEAEIKRALSEVSTWLERRNEVIRQRRKAGESCEQIAVDYDLTAERVRQIAAEPR